MVAVWTTVGVLSVVLPATASVALVIGGVLLRKAGSRAAAAALSLGILGLLASAGWLILALYVEANVK